MDGIILVFDVTNESSFTNLKTWLERIDSYAPKDQNMILVGTKIDQQERRVVDYAAKVPVQLSLSPLQCSRFLMTGRGLTGFNDSYWLYLGFFFCWIGSR